MCDRTVEFRKLTELFHRNSSSSLVTKKLDVPTSRSTFNEATSDVAKGIHKTSQVLAKLTKLVRNQGLFDDPTEEIDDLIHKIKQDILELNTKCDSAQLYVDSKKRSLGEKNQIASHSLNVVSQLKTELMLTTKGFQSVLELRSSKMKDQQQRKVELTGSSYLSPTKRGVIGNKSLTTHKPMAVSSPYAHDHSNVNNQYSDQQLLLPAANTQYYETREKAATEVEKTIQELGQLFQRLATMISQQQELIERIDDDVENAVSNADRAKSLLLQAYEKASSNGGLYMKIFGILAIFILFFVLFLM